MGGFTFVLKSFLLVIIHNREACVPKIIAMVIFHCYRSGVFPKSGHCFKLEKKIAAVQYNIDIFAGIPLI